jgi:hypothetical protein
VGLNSRPDAAGLVRAVLGGIATPFALPPELLDDLNERGLQQRR